MKIVEDDLSGPEIAVLLSEHLDGMAKHTPPDSINALDLDALRAPDVSFWSAWDGENIAGCAALRELSPEHGEIKSMRTGTAFLGRGVASLLLTHLVNEARRRNYESLSLETGSGEAFTPAHKLYEKFGFSYGGPFADYTDDPFSRFMTLNLRD